LRWELDELHAIASNWDALMLHQQTLGKFRQPITTGTAP
jgi:hypothetical protein